MDGHHWRRLRYWKRERLDDAYIAGQHNPQGVFVGRAMNIRLRLLFLLGISALGAEHHGGIPLHAEACPFGAWRG